MKITYQELEDNLLPSLKEIHLLSLPNANVDDLISLAENLSECEKISKDFWKVREVILQTYAEIDKEGERVIIEKDGKASYKIVNPIKYNEKLSDLLQTEREINVTKISKSILNDVKNIKPYIVRGLLNILK